MRKHLLHLLMAVMTEMSLGLTVLRNWGVEGLLLSLDS